ncbi:MAG: polysulfide reductase NrfD [Candidatus Latescibacteria bacterium]|nr:polysulfide reductase NrfD [Candidatus Latescibacterota bacterium]
MIRYALVGSRNYYLWIGALLVVIVVGMGAWGIQLRDGFIVTNLSDQVSWGAYIANFTFLVGVAAAAVLLVIPAYAFHREDIKRVVLIGELLAVSAIVMCLAFVTVDLGHPERALHLVPGFGRLNFPDSILAWDVIVLNIYLLLNLHLPGYLLYKQYKGETPVKSFYLPLVFLSMAWAVSIHTVTAFLYSGLGGRPFWNTAILAPRFLVSAFAAGPAILLIVFLIIRWTKTMEIEDTVFDLLRKITSFMLPLNYFLLGCELFTEFYTGSAHVISAQYLFFGISGHGKLVPYIWTGLFLGMSAAVVYLVPALYKNTKLLVVASFAAVIGIWVEKGMGLIIPGFVPTPSGDLVEYSPSMIEFLVSLGIWALGAFIFTVLAKVAIAIQEGNLRIKSAA